MDFRDLIHVHLIDDLDAYLAIRGRLKPGLHYAAPFHPKYSPGFALDYLRDEIHRIVKYGLATDQAPGGLQRGIIYSYPFGYGTSSERDKLYLSGLNPLRKSPEGIQVWGVKFIDWDGTLAKMTAPVWERDMLQKKRFLQPLREFLGRV